jgi:hypothetical protein
MYPKKINMNLNQKKPIYILILFFICTSDLMAKDQQMDNAGKSDQRDIKESVGAAAFEEQLGTETGAMGDVPVDGGITLLLAAGMAYGGRSLAANRRKRRA